MTDPAIIDEPITGEIEPAPTSLVVIILAAVAVGVVVWVTWFGGVFDG